MPPLGRPASLRLMSRLPPRFISAVDALLAAAVMANLGWTTWCLGGYRPETMAVSAPLLLLTLAGAWLRRAVVGGPHFPWWVWVWPLPFLAYALANAAVISPVPWLGWFDWSLWMHLATAYWLGLELSGSRVARRIAAIGLAVIGLGAVALAVYQRVWDPAWLPMNRRQAPQYLLRSGGPFGIPNSFAAFLLLLIPPAAALAASRRRPPWLRLIAGFIGLVLIVGLCLTISRGAWLSLVAAAAVSPLLLSGRSLAWRAVASASILILALLAGVLAYATVPSAKGRIDAFRMDRGERTRPIMWRMSWELFRESPWLGTGAGSYRVLLERHRPEHFKDSPKWAHNDYLNTLSDYGAVGFALVFGAFGAFVTAVRRRQRPDRRTRGTSRLVLGLEVGLIAFGLSLLVDFHLKIPAIAQLLGLLLAAWTARRFRAVAPAPASASPSGMRRWFPAVAAASLAVSAIVWVSPRWTAEALRYTARQRIDALVGVTDPERLRIAIEPAVMALERATQMDPLNGEAWADLSFALSQRGHYSTAPAVEIGRAAEAVAREALELSEVVPGFWLHLGIAQDLQGEWGLAGRSFGRAVTLAPSHQMMWYYQAHHYSLKPATRDLARAAVATCLRLEPGNAAAQALRDRLSGPY